LYKSSIYFIIYIMAKVEATQFELDTYLQERAENPSFVMVELGHGLYTLVDQQPHSFTGQQAYIGIETGLRGWDESLARDAMQARIHLNAFFLVQDIGSGERFFNPTSANEWYEGEYNAETILPAGAADEVVASNVFCDPMIGNSRRYTGALLDEMGRLVTDTGKVILRETLTPEYIRHIDEATLAHAGLRTTQRITALPDSDAWEKLELLYGTRSGLEDYRPDAQSHYLILEKDT
jgi:hypothetical protein